MAPGVPAASIACAAWRPTRKVPVSRDVTTRSKSSSGCAESSGGPSGCSLTLTRRREKLFPALLSQSPSGGASSASRSKRAATDRSSVTSARTAWSTSPSSAAALTAASRLSVSRPQITVCQPTEARCRAMAAPRPRLPPVTSAVPRTPVPGKEND
ncbi:hypothetical protein SMICM17S_12505 [Streptomyces microflavus]